MESSHVSALQMKHAGLEKRIVEEMNRPHPDAAMLQLLKKRKLMIKQAILHS